MIAASNYNLSDEEWAALDNECANMISTNGWYHKGQKFTVTFVKGEEYTLKLYVSNADGTTFNGSGNNVLWVDGTGKSNYAACEIVPGSNSQIVKVELTFTAKTPASEIETISSASVTMAETPKVGDDIFIPTLSSNANGKFEVTVEADLLPGWYQDDPTNEYLWYPSGGGWIYNGEETFVEGKNYYVTLKLTANDGYKFPAITTNEELGAFLSVNMGQQSVPVRAEMATANPYFTLPVYGEVSESEITFQVFWTAEAELTLTPADIVGIAADLEGKVGLLFFVNVPDYVLADEGAYVELTLERSTALGKEPRWIWQSR